MQKEILKKEGEKVALLGNEAIVRGALESGAQFISTYPGTPASEIGNIFASLKIKNQISNIKNNFYFEYSTNEKVALEAAAGASFCGLRSLVAMKNFGLNVASDFLYPLVYSGVKGGMVIVVADDPSCWSSAQSEDNSRGHVLKAHIPTLEPSTPQECKDFVKFAFELSEKFKIPVMVRTTTRVSHQSAPVILGEIENWKLSPFGRSPAGRKIGIFVKNPRQFVTMPPRVLEMHRELLEKIEKIRKFSEKSEINRIENCKLKIKNCRKGIITSGVGYLYAKEALKEFDLELPLLKLGFFYPLAEQKIKKFIKNLSEVLIIEELEPYLEKEVERLAKNVNPKLKINGKNVLLEVGELKPEDVISAVSKLIGKKTEFNFKKHKNQFQKINLPERWPRFCPGCPYNFIFSIIKKASPRNTVFGGEIGCYMLAHYPPHEMQDYLYCMGSDISIAHGIEKSLSSFAPTPPKRLRLRRPGKALEDKQKVIAFVGDSSFFHASIPALINTIFNKSDPLIIVMDNGTTAMTGHQPHPGVAGLKIEEIVRACGVKNIKIIDPIKTKEFESAVKKFLKKRDVSVIIARHPCLFIKSEILNKFQ